MSSTPVTARSFWNNCADFADWLEGFMKERKYDEKKQQAIREALADGDGATLYSQGQQFIETLLKDAAVPNYKLTAAVLFEQLKSAGTGLRNADESSSSSSGALLPINNEKFIKAFMRIARELGIQKRKRLDVWTPSKRSSSEQAEFKQSLLDYYERQDGHNNAKCMVTNLSFPRKHVIASHIWKFATHGEDLEEFHLAPGDVNSARNGMLLLKPIEEAFDDKRVCFCWDPFHKQLKLVVLDPALMNEQIAPSTKSFRDIHQQPLMHPDGKMPFRRLLSWHAHCAHRHAFARGWINQEGMDTFGDFADLSEGSSLPDDTLTAIFESEDE